MLGGHGARHAVARREEERGRARDVVAARELKIALQHGSVAVRRRGGGRHAVTHPVVPSLRAILRANDLAVILFAANHRRYEGVNGQVADRLVDWLHLATIAAVRIGEDNHLALALAENLLDGILERPLVPVLTGIAAQALLREIRLGLRADDRAREDVLDRIVHIEQTVLDEHLPNAGHGRRGNAFGAQTRILHQMIAHALLVRGMDCARRSQDEKSGGRKTLECHSF